MSVQEANVFLIHVLISDHLSLRPVALLVVHSARTSPDRARILSLLSSKADAGRLHVVLCLDHRCAGDHQRTQGSIVQLSA